MSFNIIVKTSITENDKILQELFTEHDNYTEYITRMVYDVKEVQLRNALIKLGWAPPEGE